MNGQILFNGNMAAPSDFIERIASFVHRSSTNGSPNVLLVTAAWQEGEYGEAALREALNANGVRSDWQDGYDRAIPNLCAWHAWQQVLAERPQVAAVTDELEEVAEAVRRFYVAKTSFHARRVREAVAFARDKLGTFRLGDLPLTARDGLQPEPTLAGSALLERALTRELSHDLADLVRNDTRMLDALTELSDALAVRTGLHLDPLWQHWHATLSNLILAADTLILPGGEPGALLGALRFFDLGPALREALRRGALLCTVSAGSLVLCERMIVYDDFAKDPKRREFRLLDRGLGLIGGLQILPHCMDRIHTDDPDNLAYLARRFSTHVCVGLNQESFLLVEPAASKATAVGLHDAVYVFGADGAKRRFAPGEALDL